MGFRMPPDNKALAKWIMEYYKAIGDPLNTNLKELENAISWGEGKIIEEFVKNL